MKGGEPATTTDVDFEERIEAVRTRVYNLINFHLHNRTEADDLTQETLLRAWMHDTDRLQGARVRSNRSFEAWVLRIANNLCIDYLRRRERRREMSLDILMTERADSEWIDLHQCATAQLADSSRDPATLVLETVIVEGLEASIRRLPPSQRKLLTLLESGHSYQEIADIMHCPTGTVRSRVHRTRQRLQEALSAPGER